jgi:hypothetical protein
VLPAIIGKLYAGKQQETDYQNTGTPVQQGNGCIWHKWFRRQQMNSFAANCFVSQAIPGVSGPHVNTPQPIFQYGCLDYYTDSGTLEQRTGSAGILYFFPYGQGSVVFFVCFSLPLSHSRSLKPSYRVSVGGSQFKWVGGHRK